MQKSMAGVLLAWTPPNPYRPLLIFTNAPTPHQLLVVANKIPLPKTVP
jgi:hypothetical protein